MAHRFVFRNPAFYIAVCAGVGGITPDIGHGLNLITQGKVSCGATHGWMDVLLWVWLACSVGLIATVVLRKKKRLG